MRSGVPWLRVAGVCAVAAVAAARDGRVGSLSADQVGDGAWQLFAAQQQGVEGLRSAVYRGDRATALAAVAALGRSPDHRSALPPLLAWLGAADRRLASAAAAAIQRHLAAVLEELRDGGEPVSGEIAQWCDQLATVAASPRGAPDLRVAAVRWLGRLDDAFGVERCRVPSRWLDAQPPVWDAVVSALRMPLSSDAVAALGAAARGEDPLRRDAALTALCTNALIVGVTAPTADLSRLILRHVRAAEKVEQVGGTLACLARFPYDGRAELSDAIAGHRIDKIRRFWESLVQ